MIRLLPVCIVLALAISGCAPRFGTLEQIRNRPLVSTGAVPGQSLTMRLGNGGMATVTAGQTYVSALGEECVQINEYPSIGAACLRNGEWVGLPDVFAPRPGEGMMP